MSVQYGCELVLIQRTLIGFKAILEIYLLKLTKLNINFSDACALKNLYIFGILSSAN